LGAVNFNSTQTSFINGKFQTVKQVSYTYALVAEEEGEFIIPPVRITSGRKEYLSNELKIKVIKGAQQAQPGGTANPSAPKVIVSHFLSR